MRKFFACSICKPGEDYCQENFDRIVKNNAFILHEDTIQKGVYSEIAPGDILLLKYDNHFVAYGEVIKRETTKDPEWNLWATVKEWYFKDPGNRSEGVHIYGIQGNTLEGGGQMGTVKGLEENFAIEKLKNIDPSTLLYQSIIIEKSHCKQIKNMQDKIKLLEFKKQIILQGPPGTGKTRIAKGIAKEMTLPKNLGSPVQKIDEFFKTFDVSMPANKQKREGDNKLLIDFQKKFPKEDLNKLRLEDYAIGTGSNDSFCWWIERGLKPLGYYFPGSARSYLIYWSESKDDYSTHFKHSSALKDLKNTDDAMVKIADMISKLVLNKDISSVVNTFGNSLILKILNSYYPDEYFPINSVICLKNVLKLVGIDSSKFTALDMNLKFQEFFNQKCKEFKCDVKNYEFMRFLFDNFDLKGNIEVKANEVLSKGEYKLIQFHPAYTYEDFVRGITAKSNGDKLEYIVENKILAEFAQKALDNCSANYVLIIDEINRANLPSVLGELIYALEYRYDEANVDETTVESMYALKQDKDDEEGDKILRLPKNLYIIGTMNTADRSVGHIDYAIRRRFAFVDIPPTDTVIEEMIKDPTLKNKAKELFNKVAELFHEKKNESDKQEVYLQSDFKAKDVQLGHSYFLADTEEHLELKLKFEIIPLLNEYVKDGILNETALKEISKL